MSLADAATLWEKGAIPFTDDTGPRVLHQKTVVSGRRSNSTAATLMREYAGAFFVFLMMDGDLRPLRKRGELQALVVEWYDDYVGAWSLWSFTNAEWERLAESPRLYAAFGSASLFREDDVRLNSSADRALARVRENRVLLARRFNGNQVGVVSFRPYTAEQVSREAGGRTFYLPVQFYTNETKPALFANIRRAEIPMANVNARAFFEMIAQEIAASQTITDPDRTETVRPSRNFLGPQGMSQLPFDVDPDRTTTVTREMDPDRTETVRASRNYLGPQGLNRRPFERDLDRTITDPRDPLDAERTETARIGDISMAPRPRNWGGSRLPFEEDPERTTTVPRPVGWLEERVPRPRLLVQDDPDSAIEPSFSAPARRALNDIPPAQRRVAPLRAPEMARPENPLDGYEWLVENRNGLFAAGVDGSIKMLPRAGFDYYSRLMSENDDYERVGPVYVRRDLLPQTRASPDGSVTIGETRLFPRQWTEDEKRIVPGRKHMRTAAKMWNKH
jgi:hypothetical protein